MWILGLLFCFFSANSWSADTLKIATVGDSITEGQHVTHRYSVLMDELLSSKATVRNFGVSAHTLLKKGDYPFWQTTQFAAIFRYKPDVITIMLGTNDTKPQNWGTHAAEFKGDMVAMIDGFSAMNSKPKIILVLPPVITNNAWKISNSVLIEHIIPLIKTIALEKGLDVIDVNTPFINKLHLLPDGVHPLQQGHELMAAVFAQGIEDFVLNPTPPCNRG